MASASGIHHVTAITQNVQANVDFYAGFLGLRLVKQTGGFEDAEQLHLIYGDAAGSPGSLVTFLVWEASGRGRVGLAQVSEIAFAVPPGSIGEWLQRAISAGVPFTGPGKEFGETVLRLKDPDGIIVKLVGIDMPAVAPLPDPIAPTRIRSVTILSDDADKAASFSERFGYRRARLEEPFIRMESDTDALDIRQSAGFVPGSPGAGVFDHVAFRAPDVDAVRQMRLDLRDYDGITNVHDRKYFLSLYVREPTGTLFEYATDGPGMTVDEPLEHLGETLMIPPRDAARTEALRVMLPQFVLPGQDRMPARDLPFIHRFYAPENPDGSVLVLLHGTGGSEADLMPLGHQINPRATLLGVRGRSTEEGTIRWFRGAPGGRFDEDDIRAEAEAFEAFVEGAIAGYGLDAQRMTFAGYSNGANFIGCVMRLRPQVIDRAILLRAIEVMQDAPSPRLDQVRVLMVTGINDTLGGNAGQLQAALEATGAQVEAHDIEAGHLWTARDVELAQAWLASV